MKKCLAAVLALWMLLQLWGCSSVPKQITCEQVAQSYEAAGYEIFHKETAQQESEWVCYLRATDPQDGEHVHFYFFETSEEAQAYAKTRRSNILVWFFSVIYGDPGWVNAEAWGNIVCEYESSKLTEPFRELM